MNLALQKRHEQLERWRQYEAVVEASAEQQNKQQVVDSADDRNRSVLRSLTNTRALSSSPSDTSRSRFASPYSNRRLNSQDSYEAKKSPNQSSTRTSVSKELTNAGRLRSRVKFSDSILFLTACANGDLAECERLLSQQSIHIDVTTSDGLTGLHEAAICGNVQMLEFLIAFGADINCCDNEGWTPLHAAASLGQTKIVELLLQHGANATLVNCENLLAYDLGRNEQVQSLIRDHLQGLDIDFIRSQEKRAIEQDVDRWIESGHYDERSHPITNATALHVIAAKGYVSLLKKVLETPTLKKQINIEAQDYEGFTPLLAASFWSQHEIVELLIEHGANIFAQSHSGYKISSIVSTQDQY